MESSLNNKIRAFLVLLSFFWLIAILAAPLLKNFLPAVSTFFYYFFSPICHQLPSRSFFLNGAKLAVCARCFGIYLFFFLGGLFSFSLDRNSSLSKIWLILSMIPLGVDGMGQLLGLWKSTNLLRLVTGAFFGFVAALYVFPALESAILMVKEEYL